MGPKPTVAMDASGMGTSSSSTSASRPDSPTGAIDPILSKAAVTLEQVSQNDALIQVTDQIALETVAVAVPSDFVERLNEELVSIGLDDEKQQRQDTNQDNGKRPLGHRRNWSLSPDNLVLQPRDETTDSKNVIDINASSFAFVDAITGPCVDSDSILPPSTAEDILVGADICRSDLEEPEVATATAVIAAPIGSPTAVVAEVISQELAEQADIVDDAVSASETAIPPGHQPVSYILARHPVWIAKGFPTAVEIDESIVHLDTLIAALRSVQRELFDEGLSPGFETKSSSKVWFTKHVGGTYETLPSVNMFTSNSPAIPVPTPSAAVKYYEGIRETWLERKRYVEATTTDAAEATDSISGSGNGSTLFCSCIKDWTHSPGDVLAKLSNQSLEQDMVREASDAVTVRMSQPGCMRGEAWDRLYNPECCPSPESVGHLYIPKTSIRIVGGRDDYIATLAELALAAEGTIDLATCYIFPHDPAQHYILLDLLPHVARKGVTVRLLCDMMPIESSVVKSAIQVRNDVIAAATGGSTSSSPPQKSKAGVYPLSFLDRLPPNAPAFSPEAQEAKSLNPMGFIGKVLETAFAVPDAKFQVKWWCARDAIDKYRIKNHAKCAVFDGNASAGKARGLGVALMGGSNICPTLDSGDSDLDILVGGSNAVNHISSTFNFLWDSMCDADAVSSTDIIDTVEHVREPEVEEYDVLGRFPRQEWSDKECRVALVRSEPCSAGSDAIFRHVLGAIASAKKSVIMCMGHSNKPMALANALGEAVKRGVRVQLLVNSIYSCDLRVNQRDLFRSIQNLLAVAPGVEVWTTALRSQRKMMQRLAVDKEEENGEEKKEEGLDVGLTPIPEEESDAPPFLHSKYTVVDSKWTAVGSWNVWTRSAFYEIEHELLIESEAIAARLEEKFEKEKEATSILLTTPDDCTLWCPTGCKLCTPFGPFHI